MEGPCRTSTIVSTILRHTSICLLFVFEIRRQLINCSLNFLAAGGIRYFFKKTCRDSRPPAAGWREA